jgi:hypothetical protein
MDQQDDARDLVAHCGDVNRGSYINSLVLTDIASGWTEAAPVPHSIRARRRSSCLRSICIFKELPDRTHQATR